MSGHDFSRADRPLISESPGDESGHDFGHADKPLISESHRHESGHDLGRADKSLISESPGDESAHGFGRADKPLVSESPGDESGHGFGRADKPLVSESHRHESGHDLGRADKSFMFHLSRLQPAAQDWRNGVFQQPRSAVPLEVTLVPQVRVHRLDANLGLDLTRAEEYARLTTRHVQLAISSRPLRLNLHYTRTWCRKISVFADSS